MGEGEQDHEEKPPVVLLPNTIINPNTMMVEFIDTPVTFFAVFAGLLTVAVAIFTEIMINNDLIYLFFLVLTPFISIHNSVGGVGAGNQHCR